ncbi:MAG: formyltetrahydrofolate deformylase [Alphaproteobacteria bacterium]
MSTTDRSYILTLTCPDRTGIVAAVTGFLAERDGFITELSHYADPISHRSFIRAEFYAGSPKLPERQALFTQFTSVAEDFSMDFQLRPADEKARVVVMVSKFGHCLNNLLHDWKSGNLPIDIVAVVSNHDDMRSFVEWHQIPYHHLPVTPDTKAQQEADLRALIDDLDIDLVVLARYMQILSPALCQHLAWRAINIHHSFLPSFKGARPYHQAHARGVKLIGATAHYVTTDLDEGPIIEQTTERVDHTQTPQDLVRIGRDIESVVLNRAVRWHGERRVLPNGSKTVVFR